MIKQFLEWLISHYYTPAQAAAPQSTGVTMTDVAVDTAAQTAAATVAAVADTVVADTATTATAADTAPTSALAEVKAKFEAFVEFVEHGIKVLGADAEAELVALKDKYL